MYREGNGLPFWVEMLRLLSGLAKNKALSSGFIRVRIVCTRRLAILTFE